MVQCCSSVSDQLGVMWKTVSEDCNLACDYCYYSTCGGKPGAVINRIDSKVLEKFISEYMKKSNGNAVFAWQGGEPLLAGLDFFEEVVALQSKYAPPNTIISNSLQTNGTLINEKWAEFFKTYNFLVGVSLDGPKEIHDSKRVTSAGTGSYDLVMRGINHLRKAGVEFNILTVLHGGNIKKATELMNFYKKESFNFVQFIPCMDFRAQEVHKQANYLITPEEYGNFLCEAFDLWYNDGHPNTSIRFFDNILNVYLNREAGLCIHRTTCPKTLILEQNGDAYPCDFYINDEFKLGNVGVNSLDEILANPIYHKFLSMKPNLPEKCLSCNYLNLCHGGCPRNRSWSQADELADVDYFCESYKQIYQYAHERMETIAENIRIGWLREKGHNLPGRNDLCFCGSGKKFKKCCEKLKSQSA